MLSYSGITNRGKVTLPSVDSWGGDMSIMRDPPRSIMMRRIDKVGSDSTITKMNDESDRSAECILRFARGVNPSVSVSYQNSGGIINAGNQSQAYLRYTINKDGDFHPPVQAPQDLLALSRIPRNVTSATTNPGMPHNLKELDNSRNVATLSTTKEIISSQVKATKTYFLQKPFQEPFEASKHSIQNVLHKQANPNVSQRRTTELFVQDPTKGIHENYTTTEAQSNLNQRRWAQIDNDAIHTNNYIQNQQNNTPAFSNLTSNVDNGLLIDSEMFELSNFNVKEVLNVDANTNMSAGGASAQEQHIYENFELLDRNLPEYQTMTNTSGNSKISFIHDDLELERNLPEYETHTNTTGLKKNTEFIHKDLVMERNLPEHQSRTNTTGVRKSTNFIHKDLVMERNLPEHQTRTNTNGARKSTEFIHKDLVMEKNLPNYNTSTNIVGGAKVSFIHKDMERNRNLPEYQANAGITYNMQKNIKPEYVKENERKSTVSNFIPNENKRGESNVSAREYRLEDRIQPGGFENAGSIPTFDRNRQEIKTYESDKSIMSRNVMKQFTQRYGR
jgi:hypothetical protein